jgi:benzoyl-CoA reductase/2-hydroxyglutaryl-CoA dehydratase subunit BcrC/BadD/HgdB
MEPEIRKLAASLGATWGDTLDVHERLKPVRESLAEIDRMTWQDGTVSGGENNLWLVSSSDFDGDAHLFAARARDFIREASARKPREGTPRIALVGIPPIFTDLFSFLESKGARVVFNEIPTQFRMPHHKDGLVEQYVRYTFPYDIFCRIDDIARQLSLRRVDAVIHYVQSFCFRQIQDIIVRDRITLPILTLEGDRPGPLDARTKIKLETFVEMLITNQKK